MATSHHHKPDYRPPQPTYLCRYIVFPIYDVLVTFYPRSWTPNAITLVGIFSTLLASLLLFVSMPQSASFTTLPSAAAATTSPVSNNNATSPSSILPTLNSLRVSAWCKAERFFYPFVAPYAAPGPLTTPASPLSAASIAANLHANQSILAQFLSWLTCGNLLPTPFVLFGLVGALNLIYCIADNTDGRQARRTKQSSFIGEYLDHGLDCVTSLMSSFLLLVALGVAPSLAALGVVVIGFATNLSHIVNHEHNVMIWGNDWMSVDEAMLAFGLGYWLLNAVPCLVDALVPIAALQQAVSVVSLSLPACVVAWLALSKLIHVAFVPFLIGQFGVMYDIAKMDWDILRRPTTVASLGNGFVFLFFVSMQYTPSSQPLRYLGVPQWVHVLVSPITEILYKAGFSYLALWSVTFACCTSLICHIPIVAKCMGQVRTYNSPMWFLPVIYVVFGLCPPVGAVLAVATHTAQILLNIRLVQEAKSRKVQ